MDFCKALGKVSHQHLLLKLHQTGLEGSILGWVECFLTQLTQQVVFNGVKSEEVTVTSVCRKEPC